MSADRKVEVFFDNGNRAKFKLDSVVWSSDVDNPGEVFSGRDGAVYVNEEHVCFIREHTPPEED